MKNLMVIILGLTPLVLCPAASSETTEEGGSEIVFMHTFAGVTPNRGEGGNGVLIDYLIERDNKKGDVDAATLFEELANTSPSERFSPTLACISRLDDGSCPEAARVP